MNDSQKDTKKFKWSKGITLEDAYIKVGKTLYGMAFDKYSLVVSEDRYYFEESDKLAYYTEADVWNHITKKDEGNGRLFLQCKNHYLDLKEYKAYYDHGLGCPRFRFRSWRYLL